MAEIVPFPDAGGRAPALGEVGGKGLSLWRMSSLEGVEVPSGFVLTTAFFVRWFDALKILPPWQEMLDACQGYDPDDQVSVGRLHHACEMAKGKCEDMAFDEAQTRSVTTALEATSTQGIGVSFVAVRSSSPEEDLAGMSFAGGYETVLGVKAELPAIQAAVRRVFASCLDERVFVYKKSHGIPDLTPRIAVVVQRQVAACVAGVAFSLDPISNCYDWATINTNWGLGETVVSGQCSPDCFVVNKTTHEVVRRDLGKKERSVWLGSDGGVHEKVGKSSEFTLSDAQVVMVAKGLVALEDFYGHPIDTEFGFDEQRRLLWLQARPITTHLELPPQIVTKPGQPEVLWLDIMQIVQGFTQRLSTAGLSFLSSTIFATVIETALGLSRARATVHNRPFTVLPEEGIGYLNGSFILKMIGWRNRGDWADKVSLMDFNVAQTIRELEDESLARSASSILPPPLLIAWNLPGLLANVKKNMSDLEGARRRADDTHAGIWRILYDLQVVCGHGTDAPVKGAFQERSEPSHTKELLGGIAFPPTRDLLAAHARRQQKSMACCFGRDQQPPPHILDLAEAVVPTIIRNLLVGLVAGVIAGALALREAKKMVEKVPEEMQPLLDDLSQGTPFVTTVLSDLLEDMAEALEETDKSYTLQDLMASIRDSGQGMPARAWATWTMVMDQFGHRGVGELDMCTPRYREEPEMLLEQVISFIGIEKTMRPRGLAAAAVQKREAAIEKLSQWLVAHGGDAEKLKAHVAAYQGLFCYRESGKYLLIKLVDICRHEALAQADALVASGRMDNRADVWSLTFPDLRELQRDKTADVRALLKRRRAYRERTAHVKSWPKVVTSRGRELRPKPRAAKEGEVLGHAVSPGVVTGRIKVLHAPREKPLHTGEILVAQATDPGWTPLFVPAAAVLLEVGGALQHGALVAREFGKPCVAGIEDVTERFKDGMLVEVDGTAGIVRVLEESSVQGSSG